ncbi:MAG: TldD protein [Thermoproteota archaeon]|nr:TldD protein [Thermoproteota archaeon]
MLDLIKSLIDRAQKIGASYADIRYQSGNSSTITIENGLLKRYESSELSGIGIRVIVDKAMGFASSTVLEPRLLSKKVTQAVKLAKTSKKRAETTILSETRTKKASAKSSFKRDPDSVSHEERISIALDANKAAMTEGIRNSTTRLGWFHEHRLFLSSEGSEVTTETMMTGLSQSSVATHNGVMESVYDGESSCAGFEFILSNDWCDFTKKVAESSLQAVKAKTPPAGVYEVVSDPDLIGLILHEALGHASEGDLVITNESVLQGRLGQRVASPTVTIVDDGLVEGGYFLPYDDEGVEKTRQVVVDHGILKGFLQSRDTAHRMVSSTTGNARAQGFGSRPIVRQANFFMEKGDHSFEELVEGIDEGLYIRGKGAMGGEVDVGLGAFTFRCGPSYIIKHGKVGEMVRSVSVSGLVLETLKNVSRVGKDFEIRTSLFGGCGKSGQMVRVGHGGPPVRIDKMSIGGS